MTFIPTDDQGSGAIITARGVAFIDYDPETRWIQSMCDDQALYTNWIPEPFEFIPLEHEEWEGAHYIIDIADDGTLYHG